MPPTSLRPRLDENASRFVFSRPTKLRDKLVGYIHDICADPSAPRRHRATLPMDSHYPEALVDWGFRHRGRRYAVVYTPHLDLESAEHICIHVFLVDVYDLSLQAFLWG